MLPVAINAVLRAGRAVLDIYQSDFAVDLKDDRSPLTLADRRSHDIISEALKDSSLPILSEEGKNIPYEERKNWEDFWLVDPLDGTKEFIKKNNEFTLNIALIHKKKPIMGVVYVPVRAVLYFAAEDTGAFKIENTGEILDAGLQEKKLMETVLEKAITLPFPKDLERPYTVVASRSHMSKETEDHIDKLRAEHGEIKMISAGSSLKFCLVAEGLADEYPRFGPTMEWDTAAGQAVVESAGGKVVDHETGDSLLYNKRDLLNPWFLVSLK